MSDEYDAWEPTDEELAVWRAMDRNALQSLEKLCPDELGGEPPQELGADVDSAVAEVAEIVAPRAGLGLDDEHEAALADLEHADWLTIVVGLLRSGVGTRLEADRAGQDDQAAELTDVAKDLAPAVRVLTALWQDCGVLDDDLRLTETGRWALPRGLARAWTHEEWLTDAERPVFTVWKRVLDEHRDEGSVPDAEVAAALAGALTDRVLGVAAGDLMHEPERAPVAEAMLAAADGAAAAVPLYLLARAAEGRGDGTDWVRLLERAVETDPTLEEPTAELADLRALAGDAKQAHRLYGLAGFDTGVDEMASLRRFTEPPSGTTGRNKPCPCGSGKKYKVCHGRSELHPLTDRATWLWAKVEVFARRDRYRPEVLRWADLMLGGHYDYDVVEEVADTHLAAWFALFGGGLLERLVDLHHDLLPEDERALLEVWAAAPVRLLEVTSVSAAHVVGARDVVTGEDLTFRDRRDGVGTGRAHPVLAGKTVLCRLLDDGTGRGALLSGPWEVSARLEAIRSLLVDGASDREVATAFLPLEEHA